MNDPTGAGRAPQRHVRLPVLRQTWSAVAFLHWRFDRTALLPLVPDAVDVAEADGSAWVSMVLFLTTGSRPPIPGAPPLPPFAETNLRTYLRTPDGREAIWFLSVEAASTLTSAGGNLVYGVPYHRADASVEVAPSSVRYRSTRVAEPVGHDIEVATRAHFTSDERTELDDWLTGRWRALSTNGGVPLETMVEHEPWTLRHASVERLEENVLASVGLTRPEAPDVVHTADDVEVRLGPPHPYATGTR
jgi:uncharacterized protein YqjF (DUF2071 family)